jgi:hypothetical protein
MKYRAALPLQTRILHFRYGLVQNRSQSIENAMFAVPLGVAKRRRLSAEFFQEIESTHCAGHLQVVRRPGLRLGFFHNTLRRRRARSEVVSHAIPFLLDALPVTGDLAE